LPLHSTHLHSLSDPPHLSLSFRKSNPKTSPTNIPERIYIHHTPWELQRNKSPAQSSSRTLPMPKTSSVRTNSTEREWVRLQAECADGFASRAEETLLRVPECGETRHPRSLQKRAFS